MKSRRFLSLFLILILSFWLVPATAAASEPVLPEDPNILAKAALLVDAQTGTVIYAKHEHDQLYPASLTKIMTALLVLEAIDNGKLTMDQELTASPTAFIGLSDEGSTAGIEPGEVMSVRNLLYCMLVVSANEACDILAEAVDGSVSAFVDRMNAKAKELGCENTHFVNPNGLHDPQHYTSAWDMYLITAAAMQYDDFMKICDTANIKIPATNLSSERSLHTTNHLLSNWREIGYRNPDAHGIKTGSTSDAGYCLVSSATRGSLRFLSVILGAERVKQNGEDDIRSFSETSRMFRYGFENFSYKTIVDEMEAVQEVPVELSRMDHVTVYPEEGVEVLLPKALSPEDLEYKIQLEEPVKAPIAKGEKLGTMELSYNGTVYATLNLLAGFDVEASRLLTIWRSITDFFARPVIGVLAAILLGAAVLLVLGSLLRRRGRRYGRSRGRRGRSSYHGRRH